MDLKDLLVQQDQLALQGLTVLLAQPAPPELVLLAQVDQQVLLEKQVLPELVAQEQLG
jgi:hypothetical protein